MIQNMTKSSEADDLIFGIRFFVPFHLSFVVSKQLSPKLLTQNAINTSQYKDLLATTSKDGYSSIYNKRNK